MIAVADAFKDPQQEIEFIDRVLDDLPVLESDAVLDTEASAAVRAHYEARRESLESGLASGGRVLSNRALARRGTVGWIAWIGVALVLAASFVFATASWQLVGPLGRLGVLAAFTLAFFAGGWFLESRIQMHRTGIAVYLAANAMVMVDLGFLCFEVLHLDRLVPTEAVTFGVLLLGSLLFYLWSRALDEVVFVYVAFGMLLIAVNNAVSWWFAGRIEVLNSRTTYDDTAWSALNRQQSWAFLGVNVVFGAVSLALGWLVGVAKGWRRANPVVLGGALALVGGIVFMDDTLLAGNYEGFIALVVALGLLWLGLSTQRMPITVAATIGFGAAIARIEAEYIQDVITRSVTLMILGVGVIALAVMFERRRAELLRRLGRW